MTRAPVTALTMCLLLGGCGDDPGTPGGTDSGGSGGEAGAGASATTGGAGGDDVTAIIPSDRLPLPGTWESAGVEGGIPKRDVVCADVTAAPHNADATGRRARSVPSSRRSMRAPKARSCRSPRART